MSEKTAAAEVETTGPSYLGWRGELLAELALALVPELIAHKKPAGVPSEPEYDFLVTAGGGLTVFVLVRAFSAYALRLEDVASRAELKWEVPAELVRRARASRTPLVLFLFDADKGHGRYLRLDTLPEPHRRTVTLRLPIDQPTSPEGIRKLIEDIRGEPE